MVLKEKKAVLAMLEAVSEIAIDMFHGEVHLSEEERALLKDIDYENAYIEACLSYLTDLDAREQSWFTKMQNEMAYLYGQRLMERITMNELRRTLDE